MNQPRKYRMSYGKLEEVRGSFLSADVIYMRFSKNGEIKKVVKVESRDRRAEYRVVGDHILEKREHDNEHEYLYGISDLKDSLLAELLKGENARKSLRENANGKSLGVIDFS